MQILNDGFDRVFNILHGRGGEDGTMQGLLEQIGLPYTGCGVMASALTMDKMRTKMLWKAFGLPVAEMEVVTRETFNNLNSEEVVARLGLPLMVKPSLEGSSVGLTKVKTVEALKSAVEFALKFDNTILIEEWLVDLILLKKRINAKARSCDLTKLYSCVQSFCFSAESNQLSS